MEKVSEEKQPTIAPIPIGPGYHERAWNDPPMFAKEVNVDKRPAPRKLNQRVAFPISSSGQSSSVSAPSLNSGVLPPLPSSAPPPMAFYPPPSASQNLPGEGNNQS